MSTITTAETTLVNGLAVRLRKTAVAASFAVVLLAPKVLNLRRNERTWVAFRTVLGIFGAALVILPLSLWNSYLFAIVGLAMFTVAILLPPAEIEPAIDEKTRELGASMVVNGGVFQPGTGSAAPVKLFVGPDYLYALNAGLQPLLVLPVAELSSVRAEQLSGGWVVNVRWMDRIAVFTYSGIFAEHLALATESAIRSVMRSSLPVLPQRRAASA